MRLGACNPITCCPPEMFVGGLNTLEGGPAGLVRPATAGRAGCAPVKCCVDTLFFYAINLYPPQYNRELTLTWDCPPGWSCTPVIPYVVPNGDIPVKPRCAPCPSFDWPRTDPECEATIRAWRNSVDLGLALASRKKLVGNDEITVYCSDVGYQGGISPSVTIPANTVRVPVTFTGFTTRFLDVSGNYVDGDALCGLVAGGAPSIDLRAVTLWTGSNETQAKKLANDQAKVMAQNLLLYRLAQGLVFCNDDGPVPTSIFTDDSTVIGNVVVTADSVGSDFPWPIQTDAGRFQIEYVSGMESRPFPLIDCNTLIGPPAPPVNCLVDTLIYGVNPVHTTLSETTYKIKTNGVDSGNMIGHPGFLGSRASADRQCNIPGVFGPGCTFTSGGASPGFPCNESLSFALIGDCINNQEASAQAFANALAPQVFVFNQIDSATWALAVNVKYGGCPQWREAAFGGPPTVMPNVSSGASTWRLRRTRKTTGFWPARLRIANMAALTAFLRPCVDHKTSGFPAWPGELPHRELSDPSTDGTLHWEERPIIGLNPDSQSINTIDIAQVRLSWIGDFSEPAVGFPTADSWVLEIFLRRASGASAEVYAGIKQVGTNAIGNYTWSPIGYLSASCRLWSANEPQAKTTAPLPPCHRGVGPDTDYLIADANGVLPLIDGVDLSAFPGGTIMVTQEVDKTHNGVFSVDSMGSAGTPWRLYRRPVGAGKFPLEQYSFTYMLGGATHNRQSWEVTTAGVITPWVTPIDFGQILFPPITIEQY